MQQADLFLLFTEPLDLAGFSYMVSGSVAGMVYGEPRLTNDIDIILSIDQKDTEKLASVFPIESFYCPPIEVLIIEARRRTRGHFNLIHHQTGYKADVYPAGADELQSWGLQNRRQVEIEPGKEISIAPMEYVILKKLEFFQEGGSEKHLLDIQGMLQISGEFLQQDILDAWLPRLGVEDEWKKVAP